jgi:hypothetical protein
MIQYWWSLVRIFYLDNMKAMFESGLWSKIRSPVQVFSKLFRELRWALKDHQGPPILLSPLVCALSVSQSVSLSVCHTFLDPAITLKVLNICSWNFKNGQMAIWTLCTSFHFFPTSRFLVAMATNTYKKKKKSLTMVKLVGDIYCLAIVLLILSLV